MLARRVLQIGIDDPEGAGDRDAQTSHDLRQVILDILAVSDVKKRPRRKVVEDRPQLDLFVQLLEFMDTFLHAFGDRQVERPFALAAAWPRNRRS